MSPLIRIAVAAAAGYLAAGRVSMATSETDCHEQTDGSVVCPPSSTPRWIAFALVGTAVWFVLPVLTGSKGTIGGYRRPRELSGLADDGADCGCGG